MSDASDQAEYQQYLKETGQAAAKSPVFGSGLAGPNPELNASTGSSALRDLITRTPPGSRTFIPQEGEPVEGVAPAAIPAGAIPQLGKLAEFLGSSTAMRAATGAAQGAVTDREHFIRAALVGAGTSLGSDALGAIGGKVGDIAMQIAANRKKYTPGVGTVLANEGLWGTEGMLKKQTGQKLDKAWNDMEGIANNIPGTPISGRDIGSQVQKDVGGKITGYGKIPETQISSADVPDYNKIKEFSQDVSARGDQSVSDALPKRGAAGYRAFRGKDDAAKSLTGQLSKAEQKAYSQQIKGADPTGAMADADNRYAALARARTGLDQEASLPKSVMGVASLGANKIPGGSLAASTVGQGATKGGQLAKFLSPLTRQAAVNASKDDPDRAEYEQYLKETGQSR